MFEHHKTPACPFCSCRRLTQRFYYRQSPRGEISLPIQGVRVYPRSYSCCPCCGHFLSSLRLISSKLYTREYSHSHYGTLDGLRRSFARIAALPAEKSDNAGRSSCVAAFARNYFHKEPKKISLLDIGSGLGVFPYAMKSLGFLCTALDPDPQVCLHMRQDLGLKVVPVPLENAGRIGRFDLITLNKVVEHVNDPIQMVAQCRKYLAQAGAIYIEVPDGEAAACVGKGREEFFIEHIHVFSACSLLLLAKKAGFKVKYLERLREPSSKFTLRIFLTA